MLTVPLLVIELILVLDLSRKQTAALITKLGVAAFLMIILGFIERLTAQARPSSRRVACGAR